MPARSEPGARGAKGRVAPDAPRSNSRHLPAAPDKQRLFLDKAIKLSTSTGIAGTLQDADIDMKAGTMRSDKPIDFTAQGSRIQANSVEVLDRGKRVMFRNGVKVTYSAPADSSSPQPAAPSVIE